MNKGRSVLNNVFNSILQLYKSFTFNNVSLSGFENMDVEFITQLL